MLFESWGATDAEVASVVVGDDLVGDARLIATRAITIDAPPEAVFPWLRQMGFGRGGWYSYDWIDNLGRRSARTVVPEWQHVSAGDTIPGGGRVAFDVAIADEPRSFVLVLRTARIGFSLSYELREVGDATRLVSRVRSRIDAPGGRVIERCLLGPGDGVMVRKQLLTLARRAGR